MSTWRWPQWAMIAFLGFAFFMSIKMQFDDGRMFDLSRTAVVWGWFGLQAFITWAGGIWSRK